MKPILHIVRGLPGSGKSTFAKTLGCFHVEADMFHISGGKYKYDKQKISQAHELCQQLARTVLQSSSDVVVSNTFVYLEHMRPYFEMADLLGATLNVYRCSGSYGSVHNVPPETLAKMRLDWEPYRQEKVIK